VERFNVMVNDSVTSVGIRMLNILLVVESSVNVHGMSWLSSSIAKELFTACTKSFEFKVSITS
jgi:hypothetical protein